MTHRLLIVLAVLVAAAVAAPAASAARPEDESRYIVVLKGSVSDPDAVADTHARRHGAKRTRLYTRALKGYAARIRASEVTELRRDSRVAYVERDKLSRRISAEQLSPTWGLDRIDDRTGLDRSFVYNATGAGVNAYVIDTGLAFGHSEFGGRAVRGVDTVAPGTSWNTNGEDCNGHGTHVGGTTGGSTYGVAKGVQLVGVRVLDCDGYGYNSEIIAGVDWVTRDHDAGERAVANMSLGGGASTAIDTAVKNSIADGVTYAVAAGNGNWAGVHQDACKSSPARVTAAITVSATDSADRKASWANYGSCVDWFAPGVNITSAWPGGGTDTISGTSMATPHVAGAAAQLLQGGNLSPAQVRSELYNRTTKYRVSSSRTANNHLLYTGGL